MSSILLVNPPDTRQGPWCTPPTGLFYLVSMLRQRGHDARWVDGNLTDVRAAIDNSKPEWVGVSCMTPNRHQALAVAQYAKRQGCKTILGGPHPTFMWSQVLTHYPFVDYIVRGEGEWALANLIEGSDDLRSVCYRQDGVATMNPRRPKSNLDELPFPPWDEVDFSAYERAHGLAAPRIIWSRGCPVGTCRFCSVGSQWGKYNRRSVENMCAEIEWLVSLGLTTYDVADDAMTGDMEATLELCEEIIRRGLKITWHATTRVDCVTPELLKAMAAAGCYEISYGVESGSQRVLDIMNKQATVEQARNAIAWTKAAGIKACALMIYWNVGDTAESKAQTTAFLREVQPTGVGSVNDLWILPGTPYYHKMRAMGLISDDFWLGPEPWYVYKGELESVYA